MPSLQQTPIEQFKLPRKLIRTLQHNGINTFGDLQEVVAQGKLLHLRLVGKKTAAELIRLAADIPAQPDLYLGTARQDRSESLLQLDTVSVEMLEIPKRTIHALTRAGICTIGDLLLIQPSQFSRIHRVSPNAARKIQAALAQALNSLENNNEEDHSLISTNSR